MRYIVADEIWQAYPNLTTGLVVARDVANVGTDPEVEALLAEAEAWAAGRYGREPLSAHPHVAAWRATYSSFGVKPSRYRSAVEALLRQVVKRGRLPRINRLVDLGNLVAVRHALPVAAYDLDRVQGDMVIRFARGDETFRDLGSGEVSYPAPGEVIYSDAREAHSRRWNWRQSDSSKVTLETRRILYTIEGIGGIPSGAVAAAVEELAARVAPFASGGVTTHLLNAEQRWAAL